MLVRTRVEERFEFFGDKLTYLYTQQRGKIILLWWWLNTFVFMYILAKCRGLSKQTILL